MVEFAGRKKTVPADAQGAWKLELPAMRASFEPRILRIADKTFTNVLVGEVWLAAGQSNMEFPLQNEISATTELPEATNSALRLMNCSFAGQYFFSKPFGPDEIARQTVERFYSGSWQICSPASAKPFSAVGYFFGKELLQKLQVPVGIINCSVGGSPTEAWISRSALASNPDLSPMVHGNWLTNSSLDDWCRQRGHENLDATLKAGLPVPEDDLGPNHSFKPAFLWEAGPARLAPFAICGVLWYQGESNSLEERRVRQHGELFPLLVESWRKTWSQNLPFLYCQLSSIRTNHYQSKFWPGFRDQQRRFLDTIPNTGMAVTSDIGLMDNVHPRDKHDVGHRLAVWALANTYHQPLEYSGPTPQSVVSDAQKTIVHFKHAKGLKTGDGQPLRGFEIAGVDGVYHAASAKIEGDKIVLAADNVSNAVSVRYGWQPFTDANLVNADDLPASTFEMKTTH